MVGGSPLRTTGQAQPWSLGHQAWCSELRPPVLGALSYISLRLSHMPGVWEHTLLSLDERAKPELFGVNAMKEATKRGDWFSLILK